ncbi:down syndrome cell adhesion molecule [Caerostris extrusa]|uniref:Down syndrome cell adhesion molecule n=1 Tax=Caerostris extrusa TaxID=172846 RepID=A0AAV4R235_CAEEX|nr:down syndrome cell adhesion molecule [Caerostris extrusa]
MFAAPMPAPQNSFVTLNSTFVVLHLVGWQSGGCPILHFNIQYKAKYQNQWISIPDRIPANREKTILGQLTPDREYIVMVTAHSEAGVTQGEYKFRTLPLQYSSEISLEPISDREHFSSCLSETRERAALPPEHHAAHPGRRLVRRAHHSRLQRGRVSQEAHPGQEGAAR